MKKLLLIIVMAALYIASAFAGSPAAKHSSRRHISNFQATPYPLVTIHDIQYVPPASLHIADSVGYNTGAEWLTQVSTGSGLWNNAFTASQTYYGDTVTIVALVTVPATVISYTNGWTDTRSSRHRCWRITGWGGILVRYPIPDDSAGF